MVIFGNSVPTRRFPALVAFCGVVVLATLTNSLESACRAISSSTQLMEEENGPRREVDRGGCCCKLPSTSSSLLVESSSYVLFRLRAATGSLVLEGEGFMILLMKRYVLELAKCLWIVLWRGVYSNRSFITATVSMILAETDEMFHGEKAVPCALHNGNCPISSAA